MKKNLFYLLFFANLVFAYSQTPILSFSYDQAGNQKIRVLVFNTRSKAFEKPFTIEEMKMYPNPTLGVFNVLFDDETLLKAKTISVYNLNGKLILERLIDKKRKTYSIDIQNQPKGMYLVRVELSNEKYLIKKIIKK